MSTLPAIGILQLSGITSYERAVGFSVLNLRAISLEQNLVANNTKFVLNPVDYLEGTLAFSITLSANASMLFRMGLSAFKGVLPLDSGNSPVAYLPVVPEKAGFVPFDYDLVNSEINTLELFLILAALELEKGILAETPSLKPRVRVSIATVAAVPTIMVEGDLPVDYPEYLETGNILYALNPILTPAPPTDNNVWLDNSTIINNQIILGNTLSGSDNSSSVLNNIVVFDNSFILGN